MASLRPPVLIAGPTASGKSALALALAEALGDAVIVNADALQVYDGWRILTARPSADEIARAPHALYGHVSFRDGYTVGDWLRAVTSCLGGPRTAIIVGGTGLYLSVLTRGLAAIPPVPEEIRAEASALMAERGLDWFQDQIATRDPALWARVDRRNPMRLQRAWEVLRATGRPLSHWQDETPPPVLPLDRAVAVNLVSDVNWLNARIEGRFDAMLAAGVLDEVRAMRADWDPARQSSKALGAAELIAHLDGRITLQEAAEKAKTATRVFAKRQRTWFRSNMAEWRQVDWTGAPVDDVRDQMISML